MKETITIIFTWVLMFLIVFAITLGLNLLVWALFLKILCWALPLLGITTIFGWTIAFSWKLVIVIAIIISFLRSIFSPNVNVRKE